MMSDPITMPSAGLFTTSAHAPVPLEGVSIDADISSFYAKVTVAHRYVNSEADPIEAVYVFPLEEGAAVCGFEAIIDGTIVIGEVHEREKAFEMYDDALTQGHGAFLLDEERPDVFQASIGNLAPGREVLVRLTYVTELTVDEGRLRFVIPTTVSPRYAPDKDRTGMGRPDAETLNPPVAWSVPYGLNLSVRIANPRGIAAIESPSHQMSVRMSDDAATVTLAQRDAALDRDFVLSIESASLDAPCVVVERDEDDREAIAVAFAPSFDATPVPSEVIFVVDRSGSMEGTSIDEVRRALQMGLRSMTPGCRFNIVGFGTRCEALFDESRWYDKATLAAASKHVENMHANFGGTELLAPLELVLGQPPCSGLERQIVLLTDGQVTNTDAVIGLIRSLLGKSTRIFTLGIGAGASQHLVRGIARAGNGSAEFIHPGERIEPKVMRLLARLLSPALTDVRVDWDGAELTQAPLALPPIFSGSRLLVYALATHGRPTNARLTASGPSGPISFTLPVADLTAVQGRTIGTLAARARIRELEEGNEWIASRGSQQKERKVTGGTREILALSLRYGLISREASFVAIERRDRPVPGDVKLRRVPIALTAGWGGLRSSPVAAASHGASLVARSMAPRHAASSSAERMPGGSSIGSLPDAARSAPAGFFKPQLSRIIERLTHADPVAPRRRSWLVTHDGYDTMDKLILLQDADGSWDLTEELAAVLTLDLADLRSRVKGAQGPKKEILRSWATALAVAWLRANAASRRDQWQLLVAKAERWLKDASATAPDAGTWTTQAQIVIGGLEV
jgi:hypothetical protein